MKKLCFNPTDVIKLCWQGEKVIESEHFLGVDYMVKNGNLVIIGQKSGTLAVALDKIPDLTNELWDLYDTWKDVDTIGCKL